MLTVKTIENNRDFIVSRLNVKGFDAASIIDEIIETEGTRRKKQTELETLFAEQNRVAKDAGVRIGVLKKEGKHEEAEIVKQNAAEESTKFKTQSAALETEVAQLEKQLHNKLILLPNLPHELVSVGKSAEHNEIVKESGTIPDSAQLPHWELTTKYGLIDFEAGNKLTGAGFPVYTGKGAKLQRALISMFLDHNTEKGYLEVQPPLLINADSGFGTGQLPDKEGQMYHVTDDDFYLIPTAEVPVTNLYRNVIVSENELPVKLTA
ncbi:MAG: serine--tRNA ligase, partial [Prevotellaceae bacterium]|nr:serine--tRNA ligase [Prevotellaceae bacterium]